MKTRTHRQVKVNATLTCDICMTPVLVTAALAASYLTRAKGAPVILFLMMTVSESTEIHPIHHRSSRFGAAQREACRHCSPPNENTSGVLVRSQLHKNS